MSKKNKVRDARFSKRPSAPSKPGRPGSGGSQLGPQGEPKKPSQSPSVPTYEATSLKASVKPTLKPALPSWLSTNLLVPTILVLAVGAGLTVWYRSTHPSVAPSVSHHAAVAAHAAVAPDAAAGEAPDAALDPSGSGEAIEPLRPTPTTPDPMHGVFTLAQATAGIAGAGPLAAEIETSMGTFTCELLTRDAPITVANFIGLATGRRDFWDPIAGGWTRRPFYDGSIFHRVIPEFMIQGGDLLRSGSGAAGYEIIDENVRGHDAAGQLCMANHGPNTGSGQFFITEAPKGHLDGSYSIFGRCQPTELVGRIARVPVAGERPISPVFIRHVRIRRAPTP